MQSKQSIGLTETQLDEIVQAAFEQGREQGHREVHRGIPFQARDTRRRASSISPAPGSVANVKKFFDQAMASHDSALAVRLEREKAIDRALARLEGFARGA